LYVVKFICTCFLGGSTDVIIFKYCNVTLQSKYQIAVIALLTAPELQIA